MDIYNAYEVVESEKTASFGFHCGTPQLSVVNYINRWCYYLYMRYFRLDMRCFYIYIRWFCLYMGWIYLYVRLFYLLYGDFIFICGGLF